MSAESQPITPEAFAEAIKALPLSAVYAKVFELRNSIAHLKRSNAELRLYILESEGGPEAADNKELESYIRENEGVIEAMTERIALCKAEVENRGQQWIEEGLFEGGDEAAADVADRVADGVPEGDGASPVINGTDRAHDDTIDRGHDETRDGTSATEEEAAHHSGLVNGVPTSNSDSTATVAPSNAPDRHEEPEAEGEGIYL
ncbi:hypothetical protein VTN96DRAFT_6008 [Rasamsonia emersonii]|uniref:Uncharacterized protein n=1 Tax=Rasamsonia emersonii (strain ATCC 16479 / CBS 393.64 / IMI 116815) TaxID=1408163 RepID=A0A0F4Z0R3_RASE3|nr:hypothetical protein T310_2529 [Rasamsonia emersonii CBS 393.64]KKA23463.1 hypothetical protein T310_2529 [Rasamsonia emersonii CBS 393.64]